MRHVTSVSTMTFFLSMLKYSAGAGRENVKLLSSVTMVSNGALTCKPGWSSTRRTLPKRVSSAYCVTSTVNTLATSVHTASAMTASTAAAARQRRVGWPVPGLIAPMLFASSHGSRLQQPHVEVLDVARIGHDELLQARQRLLDAFELQPELGEFRRAPIGAELQLEAGRIASRMQYLLLLESECLFNHGSRVGLRLVHHFDCKDVGAIDGALLVFLRTGHIAKGIVHFSRWVHVQQLERHHFNAAADFIQSLLQRLLDVAFHTAAFGGIDSIDAGARGDAAQSCQSHATHERIGLGHAIGIRHC